MKKIKIVLRILTTFIVNIYYKLKFNLIDKNKRLLIYTDSRGFLINCFLCNKTPKNSYISMLSKEFNIDYQLCTKTHTTILDFLNYIENKNLHQYDYIILHLGIVDFSTRPLSQFDKVYNKKNKISKKLFSNIEMKAQYYDDIYEGEKTFTLYDKEYFRKAILPRINEISKTTKIIWIGINRIDLYWDGNYAKKRPSNINNILEYQKVILNYIKNNETNITYIDIDSIESFNLKKHTVDNIHLSKDGFELFYCILKEKLK
ncbi:hypothetical protein Q6A90_05365 [Aliarcobacter skirrowii]|uniref:hypothetical protein n=1 Tax=Aliarcobacter skirrowii TaxID=28200 RepID=UPI0029B369C1|nr:hypothetical protein [Aliarcobacter skirrowii]MDX4061793.1 hypothetical protein [Aliarcobacter skirrowii]